MSSSILKASLIKSGLAASLLLVASGPALAQSEVTLTAAPTATTLPDGQTVRMWGYSCSAVSGTGVSCTAMNGVAHGTQRSGLNHHAEQQPELWGQHSADVTRDRRPARRRPGSSAGTDTEPVAWPAGNDVARHSRNSGLVR
jgi:hypothetical protein